MSHSVAPSASTSSPRCAHCAEPVPQALLERASEEQFCCSGCRSVYRALRDNGLLSYYEQRARFEAPGQGRQAKTTGESYAHYDAPEFRALHVRDLPSGLNQIELMLEGLHCPACVWLVEKLPQVLPGIETARLNFSTARLTLTWEPDQVALSTIASKLDALGYPPHPAGLGASRAQQRRADRALLTRIGVAGAAFGNVMLMGFALYSGEAHGMSDTFVQLFRWGSFAIAVPSVMWTGLPFFRGAWHALRTRTAHMDLPISIGVIAALIGGSVATVRGTGEIYFDTATMLVFLLLLGRWLQAREQRAAREATDLLFALAPATSRVLDAGEIRQVPTASVAVDALVELRAGDRVGVDGVIVEGNSDLDESLLTGESRPVRKEPGQAVAAGTVNMSARLVVRATKTGGATRLAELIRNVEAASTDKPRIVQFADRMSGVFTAWVLALALFTLWLWGVEAGAPHAIALLIVTCPCALGLATPLAASVAQGRAARRGILIKGMRFIELLSKPALIVFDKTGTLTCGQLSVVDFTGGTDLAALIRAAERGSAHPIARAFERDLPLAEALPVTEFRETPGAGVQARVAGKDVRIGNARFVSRACNLDPLRPRLEELLQRGLSPVFIAVDGKLEALVGLGDRLRPDVRAALLELRALGYRLALLSGDRQEIVDHVCKELGSPFELALGRQSPERKLQFIEAQRAKGTVFMVGDGVNDAAALAAAHVGIAVHGGAEASLAAADVFTTRGGTSPLVSLVKGARRTSRVIYWNLALSLSYNLCAAALSVLGYISPLVAAVLMPLSSLSVLMNSLRAKTFEEQP